jgi:hypothetical protein
MRLWVLLAFSQKIYLLSIRGVLGLSSLARLDGLVPPKVVLWLSALAFLVGPVQLKPEHAKVLKAPLPRALLLCFLLEGLLILIGFLVLLVL